MFSILLGTRPRQEPLYFLAQRRKPDRLGEISGKSRSHGALAVALHRTRGKRNNRGRRKRGILAQFLDDLETVAPRHMNVEDDEVRVSLPGETQSFQAVAPPRSLYSRSFRARSERVRGPCALSSATRIVVTLRFASSACERNREGKAASLPRLAFEPGSSLRAPRPIVW